MKPAEKEIKLLENHVAILEQEISMLQLKYQAAMQKADKYSCDIKELRDKCRYASQQIHQITIHQNGLFMWENIGDGG
ncbi:MAG: hypothetical protein FJ190_13355 [Gammaproteobacteria bacterium]|nr:hypothetical protein [Gammaproteobacteria bacterium]